MRDQESEWTEMFSQLKEVVFKDVVKPCGAIWGKF